MNDLKLLYFAGHCLALDEKPHYRDEVIRTINSKDFNLNRFVFVCSGHLVLQTIYLKFKAHYIFDEISEELSVHLKNIYELNVSRNEQILEQVKHIALVLSNSNIKPVFLKGSGNLADGVYNDTGERLMGDIDFLVSDDDYLKTAELLKNEGYFQVEEIEKWHEIEKAKHYPSLSHSHYPAYVEIHRLPTDQKYSHLLNSGMIQGAMSEIVSVPGGFVPADQHKIMHNFIHGQLSNKGNLLGIVSLRDVYDLYLLSKRFPLNEVPGFLGETAKLKAYFTISGKILGLDDAFYAEGNFAFWLFNKKHKLSLSSKYFYTIFHGIIFFYERVFESYFMLAVQMVYSRKKRTYFIRRISNKKWYSNHLKLYTRFFKGQN